MRAALLLLSLLMLPAPASATGCAVVLSNDNPADFAAAGALAGAMGLDIITTRWGTLSNESVQEARATKCIKVFVVGGPAAVPGAEDALAQFAAVERIGGADRYETSALVAGKWDRSSSVFIADGRDTQGISDAAERAAAAGAPIVFVRPDGIPQAVADAIAGLDAAKATLIPSPATDASVIEAGIRGSGAMEVEIIEVDTEQRAQSAVEEANAAVSSAGAGVGEVTDAESMAAFRQLEKAREYLSYAQVALDAGKYSEAFGNAAAATENAEYATKISSGIVVGYLQSAVDAAKKDIEALVKNKVDIGELAENPVKYGGRDVQVTGSVPSDPVYIGEKTYIEIEDFTGRIIVEKEGFMGPPLVESGDTITVTGTVRINPSFGGPHGAEHAGLPSYILEAAEIEHVL